MAANYGVLVGVLGKLATVVGLIGSEIGVIGWEFYGAGKNRNLGIFILFFSITGSFFNMVTYR